MPRIRRLADSTANERAGVHTALLLLATTTFAGLLRGRRDAAERKLRRTSPLPPPKIRLRRMSALPPIADMVQLGCDVRFVPKADSCSAAKKSIRSPRQRAAGLTPGR